jgi:hypothetical protein
VSGQGLELELNGGTVEASINIAHARGIVDVWRRHVNPAAARWRRVGGSNPHGRRQAEPPPGAVIGSVVRQIVELSRGEPLESELEAIPHPAVAEPDHEDAAIGGDVRLSRRLAWQVDPLRWRDRWEGHHQDTVIA